MRAKLKVVVFLAIPETSKLCRIPGSACAFQNGSSTSGILNRSTVSGKFTCDDLCGESEWKHCSWLVVARQISGMSRRSCRTNIMYML